MKILVSDYDQTFYLNDEDIKENIESLKDFIDKGNMFIIATGRSYLDFKKVYNKYNFYYDYAIINHGSTIIDNKDNIIYDTYIDNNIIDDLKNDLDLNNSVSHFCCSSLESRVLFNYGNISKINIKYLNEEEAINIIKIINNKYSKYIKAFHISPLSIEIVSNKVNKANAIEIIIDKLKLDKSNVYTIGDGYSDTEMIKNYKGYTIKNSKDEVKKVAIKEYVSVHELIKDLQNM